MAYMKEIILRELSRQKAVPCVSVLISTEKKSFGEKINFENEVTAIEKELKTKINPELAQKFTASINDLLIGADIRLLQHGIGIFINPVYSKLVYFSFPVKPKIVVNSNFELREVIADQNKLAPYYALLVCKDVTRLFQGSGPELVEVLNDDFPILHDKIMAQEHIESWRYFKASEPKTSLEKLDVYFKKIDSIAGKYIESFPLVLMGTDKYIRGFSANTRFKYLIVGEKTGSYNKHTIFTLSQLVWPVVQNFQEKDLIKSLDNARKLLNMNKGVSGIQDTWDIAKIGIGKELFVEEDFICSGFIKNNGDGSNGQLVLTNDNNSDYVEIKDAVEVVMETLLNTHGTKIHLVENDTLKDAGRIILTTKY